MDVIYRYIDLVFIDIYTHVYINVGEREKQIERKEIECLIVLDCARNKTEITFLSFVPLTLLMQ